MSDILHTYASGEAFREVSGNHLTVYLGLVADDWQAANAHLRFSDPLKWQALSELTDRLLNDESERNAFRDRVAKDMDKYDESVTILEAHAPLLSCYGVVRWRVFNPKLTPDIHGMRRLFGRMISYYPYMYAPDFLVDPARESPLIASELLDDATTQFKERTGKETINIIADTLEGNKAQQWALLNAGFEDHKRTPSYPTPELFTPVLGSTYRVHQFHTTQSN